MSRFPTQYRPEPGETKATLKDWLRIGRYLLPEWRYATAIVVCIVVTALLSVVPGLLIRRVIDEAIPRHDFARLAWLVAGMILAPLIGNLIGVGQAFIATRLGQDVIFSIRSQMFDRLLSQSLDFFTRTKGGEILSRLQSDVAGVQGVVSNTAVNLASNTLTVVVTAMVILRLDWRLAFVALFILPIFILPTRHVGRARGDIVKQTQEKTADFTAYLHERLSVGGFLLMRLFGARDIERAQFRGKAETLRELVIRQSTLGRWFMLFIMSFASIGPALIYLIGGSEAMSGRITTGTIVAFVGFLGRLYAPASSLVNAHVDLLTAASLFRRIFGYLDLPAEAQVTDARTIAEPRGHMVFDSVSLAYGDPDGRRALDDVSFEILPGQMVALVGPSGAGKTSLAYLAARLYDPTHGRVVLDGVDLRQLDPGQLAALTATVTQEAIFFNTTIRDSLLYARPDASDDDLLRACEIAQIVDVITALPDGLATVIGERGYKLSGGEKQRLSLARVALRNPRLIILDEATSSLDSRSEARISAALGTLLTGRSSLVIAHRLSTIVRADLILVMDHGRIVERGTHDALLAADGLYRKLYQQQFSV